MRTSVGDIDIELWSKEAPKACRNFVQLAMEGYFDNTIFHRVVKGQFIQMCVLNSLKSKYCSVIFFYRFHCARW